MEKKTMELDQTQLNATSKFKEFFEGYILIAPDGLQEKYAHITPSYLKSLQIMIDTN